MINLSSLTKLFIWIPITTNIIVDGTYPFNVLPGNNIMGQPWLSTYKLMHYPRNNKDYELLIQFQKNTKNQDVSVYNMGAN